MQVFNKKLILASKSPRRSQLLREAGFSFINKTKDVDESYPEGLKAHEVAEYIASKKAKGCADFLEGESPDTILITSDTIVVLNDKIYGKPKDYKDAVRILKELSGQTHMVITGVCLQDSKKQRTFHGISNVTFSNLTDDEIDYYLNTCKPYDKAGSYGVQEWLGHCKITKIEGTYANIMGLPVDLVYENLLTF
jgi:septum formation protein